MVRNVVEENKAGKFREVRNSKWEGRIVILNTVARESLTKMIVEQTYKRDADEPHLDAWDRFSTDREDPSANALGQEQRTHLYGSYWIIIFKKQTFCIGTILGLEKDWKDQFPYALYSAPLVVNLLNNHGTFFKTKKLTSWATALKLRKLWPSGVILTITVAN